MFLKFEPQQMGDVLQYLRDMIKNSKAWAQARGLCETSEIHGKEEWRIPVERKFEHNKINGTESRQHMSFVAEDRDDSNSLDGRPTKTWFWTVIYQIGHHIKLYKQFPNWINRFEYVVNCWPIAS